MELRTWIRRDRDTGQESEVKEGYVTGHLEGAYTDMKAAIAAASKDAPLTNGYADYWPKMMCINSGKLHLECVMSKDKHPTFYISMECVECVQQGKQVKSGEVKK